MSRLRLYSLLAGLATGVLVGALRSAQPVARGLPPQRTVLQFEDTLALAHLDSLVQLVVLADPWGTGFVLEDDAAAWEQPAQTAMPPATLTLRGIVGGPPWTALVEGLPGSNNTLAVATGDTSGLWKVVVVSRDTVVVRAAGSSVTLSVSRSWK